MYPYVLIIFWQDIPVVFNNQYVHLYIFIIVLRKTEPSQSQNYLKIDVWEDRREDGTCRNCRITTTIAQRQKNTVVWPVMSFILLNIYGDSGGHYCLHLLGRTGNYEGWTAHSFDMICPIFEKRTFISRFLNTRNIEATSQQGTKDSICTWDRIKEKITWS